MARLTLATIASGVPMGQQVYEREIAARAERALHEQAGQDATAITINRSVTRSLRSPLPGTVRVPHWLLSDAPAAVRRAAGAVLYGRADIVHRMGLALPPARVPEVVTVHDTVAWRFPDESVPEPHAAAETRRAAAVIAVSRFAADDAAERLGLDRVHVVYNGVDERFFDADALPDRALARLGIDGPYVLHAGGASLRKNLEGLAKAWPRVHAAHPELTLVLAGPPAQRRDRLFAPLPRTRRVGRVPDSTMPGLVAGARAVVVPSLYEGFGLPALEAMAARVPVVAAARSSLPEVCGDAAILVEPDGPGLADGIVHAVSGSGEVAAGVRRGRERAGTFTWDAAAAGHARIWRAVLAGRVP